MILDATVIAAFATAFSAIIAPVLSAWISNRYQYKAKKLELIEADRIDAVRCYVSACGAFLATSNTKSRADYYQCYGEIFLYTDRSCWDLIRTLHCNIESGNYAAASKLLPDLAQALSPTMEVK